MQGPRYAQTQMPMALLMCQARLLSPAVEVTAVPSLPQQATALKPCSCLLILFQQLPSTQELLLIYIGLISILSHIFFAFIAQHSMHCIKQLEVELSVCDSETCSERCNDGDAQVASTPTEVGEQCDVIVGMLADPAAARAVASDVAKGLGPGRKLLVCQPCIHALPLTWQCRAVDHVRNMQDQQQLVTNSVPACSPRTR